MKATLVLQKVTRCFDECPIFEPIDCELTAKQWLHIQGRNGSGKTTLLESVANLQPSQGSITLNARPITMDMVQYIGHDPGFYGHLTIEDNLQLRAQWQGCTHTSNPCAYEKWHLTSAQHQPCDTLSYGQKKKAAFMSLSHDIPLWLLDEPCNGLDAQAIVMLEAICKHHPGVVCISAHRWPFASPPQHVIHLKPWGQTS